jgi:hypothetical protein
LAVSAFARRYAALTAEPNLGTPPAQGESSIALPRANQPTYRTNQRCLDARPAWARREPSTVDSADERLVDHPDGRRTNKPVGVSAFHVAITLRLWWQTAAC